MAQSNTRDHGGNLTAAIARFGGTRDQWSDLSTGINPVPYPLPDFSTQDWAALPDTQAQDALISAARAFWDVPDEAAILAAPGASSLIARLPTLRPIGTVDIAQPTYNEHAASFTQSGWTVRPNTCDARVIVHPNNPDGRLWAAADLDMPFMIIDESFCDITPEHTLIKHATRTGLIILKSFGKFWGLAGLRLGFAIGDPILIAKLSAALGPWPVSGPALAVGVHALRDTAWAAATRHRLAHDTQRLDQLMQVRGAKLHGGTNLFRLYHVDSAKHWQDHLAAHHIWSRIFPYSEHFIRLGLPPEQNWPQLEKALS